MLVIFEEIWIPIPKMFNLLSRFSSKVDSGAIAKSANNARTEAYVARIQRRNGRFHTSFKIRIFQWLLVSVSPFFFVKWGVGIKEGEGIGEKS